MPAANTRLFKRITNVHWRSGTFIVKMVFRAHMSGASMPLTTYKINTTLYDITQGGLGSFIAGDAFVPIAEPPTQAMVNHLYAWTRDAFFFPPDGGTGARPFVFYNEVHNNTIDLNMGKIAKDFPSRPFVDVAIPAMHGDPARIFDDYIVYMPVSNITTARFGGAFPIAPTPPSPGGAPRSLWIASLSARWPTTIAPLLIACDADDAIRSIGSPQADGTWFLGVSEANRGPAPNLPVNSIGGASEAQFICDTLNNDSPGGGPIWTAAAAPYFGVPSRSIGATSVQYGLVQDVLPALDAAWTIQFKLYSWDATHGLTLLDTVNRSASGQSLAAQNLRLSVEDNRLVVT